MSRVHPLLPEQRAVTPRDLAWLAVSILLVAAPHAERVPWWVGVFALCLLGWRAFIVLNAKRMPARWLPLVLAVYS